MTTAPLASSLADSQAGEAIRTHHAALSGALQARVSSVLRAADSGLTGDTVRAAAELASWCERELVPHAEAEERTLYSAAGRREETRLLVVAMSAEHGVLVGLVHELAAARTVVEGATAARALQAVFRSHLEKENDILLPVLEAAPDVDLAGLLDGMHEALTQVQNAKASADRTAAAPLPASHGEHRCGCDDHADDGFPVLDARAIPHAVRHATILGGLGAVGVSGGMVLVAPHDPLPLLSQIDQAFPDRFVVRYLERGPEAWQLEFTRAS